MQSKDESTQETSECKKHSDGRVEGGQRKWKR